MVTFRVDDVTPARAARARRSAIYLTITPQLLAEASRRFEALAEPAWTQGKA
jgi:hypothetical protein